MGTAGTSGSSSSLPAAASAATSCDAATTVADAAEWGRGRRHAMADSAVAATDVAAVPAHAEYAAKRNGCYRWADDAVEWSVAELVAVRKRRDWPIRSKHDSGRLDVDV